MFISQNGIKLLISFEGRTLKAYDLGDGGYTIGVGHYGDPKVNKDTVWTAKKCDAVLKQDVKKFEKAIDRLNIDFTQCQFDALLSYTFNRGVGGLHQLVNACDRDVIKIGVMLPQFWGSCQKYKNALIKRRKKERIYFFSDFRFDGKNPKKICNTSPKHYIMLLQCLLGLEVDGIWGKKTSSAVTRVNKSMCPKWVMSKSISTSKLNKYMEGTK